MRGEPEHDEVGVQPVQDVVLVGVVARLAALAPHEVHDLVLALPGLAGVREDHLRKQDEWKMGRRARTVRTFSRRGTHARPSGFCV